MAGLVEDFCLKMLPQADLGFLLARTLEYNVDVADERQGDKAHVLKLLLRHLTSADVENSPDHGAALFLKLYSDLGTVLKDLSPTVKREEDDVTTLSYRKLRQFKINGTIGDPGQKNCLSYSSLLYQLNLGEEQGYTLKEIHSGVVRAIEAGNPIRELLELERDDLKKESFLETLKSHFQEQDPNSVFNELRTAAQRSRETAHKFCCRCVALKRRVTKLSESGGVHVDRENLNATFYRTIYTGLKQTEIRNELRQVLKEADLDDSQLLREVSEAQAREEERLGKMGESSNRGVNINKLTLESDSDETESNFSDSSASCSSSSAPRQKVAAASSKKQKNAAKNARKAAQKASQNTQNSQNLPDASWTSEMNKMTAAFEKLTASNAQLSAEVNVLKSAVASGAGSHGPKPHTSPILQNNNVGAAKSGMNFPTSNMRASAPAFSPYVRFTSTNRPVHLCKNCHSSGSMFCRHCFTCGGGDHKTRECPSN